LYGEKAVMPARQSLPPRLGLAAGERTLACEVCEKLEREYQAAIRAIYAAVSGRFNSLGEKLWKLHRLQDLRDDVLAKFYEHKQIHRAAEASRKRDAALKVATRRRSSEIMHVE
jgi:hypothetical protein